MGLVGVIHARRAAASSAPRLLPASRTSMIDKPLTEWGLCAGQVRGGNPSRIRRSLIRRRRVSTASRARRCSGVSGPAPIRTSRRASRLFIGRMRLPPRVWVEQISLVNGQASWSRAPVSPRVCRVNGESPSKPPRARIAPRRAWNHDKLLRDYFAVGGDERNPDSHW